MIIRWKLAVMAIAAAVPARAAPLGDWRADAPGAVHRITVADLPKAFATPPAGAPPAVVPRPAGAKLSTLPGYSVRLFAKLDGPRQIRVSPGGDIFVAETDQGRVRVLRATDGAEAAAGVSTFAEGLDRPFGIAFYPPGADPRWVYVANANSVVRYPYRAGDLKARGLAQTVVAKLAATTRGHSTRDVAFSADGKRMFVSVGSASNVAESMPAKTPEAAKAWDAAHGQGAAWGDETDRADVLVMGPDGAGRRVFAAGLRNCVSLAVQPVSGVPWCVVNERDDLGDDLPPDYVTSVREGGFYGWPWFYIGGHLDPRLKGARADLAGKVLTPDVLLAAHSAPLGLTFYTARAGPAAFPADTVGDAFVALHGSWNRGARTGYKVVRVRLRHGVPTGGYEDVLTGFVVGEGSVWGRPVGVATAHDGALLVTDDASGAVWRIAYDRNASARR